VLWFDGRRVRVLRVPGHTLGALAYVVDDALFSGDTLFASGCGRLFEGTPQLMQRSLEALRSLPVDTKLYAGHEYTVKNLSFAATIEPNNRDVAKHLARAGELRAKGLCTLPSTLGDELVVNPFLRWDAPDVITRALELGAPSRSASDVFAAVRRARDVF
jgi:hydroxyacylglutathione hydrolase